ncbi:MAG: pyridoxal phosphate-dependent aminotransferase [Rhodothermales bacterium]|nr:pyridoxal phosphate-dependent aminotransferase [Rhodothermales bacterium]
MAHTQSTRMQRVQDPIIPIVARLIRDNAGTISLGQGVVHYGPPPQAREALAGFWESPANHLYNSVQGMPALRARITEKLAHENQIVVEDERQLFVTAGGNMAFMNALAAIASAGDEVILVAPYYFNHEMAITMLDCQPVIVPSDERYQLDLERIEQAITPRTRAIVTVSPNNPSGAVYPEADLRAVNAVCARRGIYHISDEAYEYFTFGNTVHFSPGSVPEAGNHTISLFSLSKAYGFAGWRIGYMCAPAPLHMAIAKAQDTMLICAPIVCQLAAAGALEAGRAYCTPFIAEMGRLRDRVLNALTPLGGRVRIPSPDGAFYALLRLDTPLAPLVLVERLIREHRVAVIPGTAFGMMDGCYIRVAFGALLSETVEEGVGRLVEGLQRLI